MTGLDWTYEYLCEAITILTRNSSSPTSAADLNPIIKQILTDCPGSSIFGIGGHSVLLSITDDIVAKVSLKPGGRHVRHEQTIFDLLDRTPCPHIVQTFLRCPDITFMESLKNGTLYERMSMVNTSRPILQWMQQLSDAAACLESLGYAHGDISPRNILFDNNDQLKLVDFDHSLKIGENLDVGYEPYVRSRKRGQPGGDFGIAGPITEQLALASTFWFMTRGAELYHELEGPEQVNRLMNCQFPPMDPGDPIDNIISDCWLGKFQSIADLSRHIREVTMFDETYRARKKECEQYYQLLKSLASQSKLGLTEQSGMFSTVTRV
jgi:serine/threonine protein kinase